MLVLWLLFDLCCPMPLRHRMTVSTLAVESPSLITALSMHRSNPFLVSYHICIIGGNGSTVSVNKSIKDCMLLFQTKKHNLTVNLTTFRIWCYVCEREVFLEHRASLMPVAAAPRHCRVLEQVLSSLWGCCFNFACSAPLSHVFIVQHYPFPRKWLLSQ